MPRGKVRILEQLPSSMPRDKHREREKDHDRRSLLGTGYKPIGARWAIGGLEPERESVIDGEDNSFTKSHTKSRGPSLQLTKPAKAKSTNPFADSDQDSHDDADAAPARGSRSYGGTSRRPPTTYTGAGLLDPEPVLEVEHLNKRTGRLPWLDNAKFFLMCYVYVGHACQHVPALITCYADSHPVPPDAPERAGEPISTITSVVADIVTFAHVDAFMFIAGVVATVEVTSERLTANAVALLLPLLLFHTWAQFFLYVPIQQWFSTPNLEAFLHIGERLWSEETPLYWFLTALFQLRLALGVLGRLPSVGVLAVAIFAYATFYMFEYKTTDSFYRQAVLYCPWFFLGHLFQRHGLVDSTIHLLTRWPAVRAAFLAGGAALWVLPLGYGLHPPQSLWPGGEAGVSASWQMSMEEWTAKMPVEKLGEAVWMLMWGAAYTFTWVLLVPPDPVPVITEAGSRTLAAYLFLHEAGYLVTLCSLLVARFTTGLELWVFVLLCPVAMALLFTSHTISFALWPVITPTWVAPIMLEERAVLGGVFKEVRRKELCSDEWWNGYGLHVWIGAFLAVSFSFQIINRMDVEYFDMLINGSKCSALHAANATRGFTIPPITL